MTVEEYIAESYRQDYSKLVKSMARTLKYNKHLAEDIVQETYERALRYADSFNPELGEFKTWLNKILFTTLRQVQLDNRRQEELGDIPDWVLSTVYPEIMQIIDKVTNEQHRSVLFSYYILGYNSTEISRIIPEISVSNVTTICKRFRDYNKL